MRSTLFVLGLAALAGCSSSAPVAPPPPVAPVRVQAPPPPPPVARIEPELPELAPITPPVAPRLRVSQRSVFEEDRIVRWSLQNGLTVLYAWDDGATESLSQVGEADAPGGFCLIHDLYGSPDSQSIAVADGVASGVRAAREQVEERGLSISRTTVTLHGAIHPEWVEAEVATTLGAARQGSRSGSTTRNAPVEAQIKMDWDDLPALAIAAAVLADRLAPSDLVHVTHDAADGTVQLSVETLALPVRQWLAPGAEGAVRDARARAARAAASGPGVTAALHQLGRLPGRYQPARPPSDVRRLPSQIERTSPDRVNAILARLAAALSPTE